ncbi:synaptosomal-associated protein 29 [Toxorhynchites rutilus septentrionalis]|uniref:synaptosomal-associated protein 29 n=1 Tax=Toxorhynchites rutilus septentrionalis TaxID=329112 RepID=UPI002478859A|nr:synaptosomal-associated protein 29 [Toxorhynchites rutilus septentrionalis]
MSGHQYVPNPSNLFADDDEIDDELFLRNARRTGGSSSASDATTDQGYKYDQFQKSFLSQNYDTAEEEKYGSTMMPGASMHGGAGVYGELDSDMDDEIVRQRQTFEQRRRELEESTLLTSQRCLGVLRETEQVGIATAEELHRQREQLEKTKKQLDEINNSLRFSQKHLNSLKSVFGGLKNYLSGRMGPDQQQSSSIGIARTNISPSPSEEIYPNPQDFRIPSEYWPDATRGRPDYHNQAQDLSHMNGGPSTGGNFSHELDQNLDDMRGNLSRLKNLALDLNQEIDSQNDLIDDISNRVDDVDVKIGKQNKDMNRLLRK